MSKELLIYTISAGVYTDWNPLFKRCCELQYPEYDVMCGVYPAKDQDDAIVAASMRFLKEPPTDHPYVFITDVDLFPIRQDSSIFDFHMAEIKESNLCYSNSVRGSEPMGYKRLTGLHYVTREWYRKTSAAREYYLQQIGNGWGRERFDDELMLFDIVNRSDLEMCGCTGLIKRHGGLHAGTARGYRYRTRNTIKFQLRARISPQMARGWISNYEDPEFREIEYDIKKRNRDLKWQLETIYSFCMGRVKQ